MKICGRDSMFCFKEEIVNHKIFLQLTKQVTCGRKQGIVQTGDIAALVTTLFQVYLEGLFSSNITYS